MGFHSYTAEVELRTVRCTKCACAAPWQLELRVQKVAKSSDDSQLMVGYVWFHSHNPRYVAINGWLWLIQSHKICMFQPT